MLNVNEKVNLEGIDTRSTNFIANYENRLQCEEFYEGEKKVKEQGTKYLPQLDLQDDIMYSGYKARTRFFNVFKKTINGFAGLMIRKNAKLEIDGTYNEELINDVTLSGKTLNEYVKDIIKENLKIGFCGTLVDHPIIENDISEKQREESNIRPCLFFYKYKNIINYKYERINNVLKLSLLVLEYETENKLTIFKSEIVKNYQLLLLDNEVDENGNDLDNGQKYYRNILIKKEKEILTVISDTFPLLNNNKIDFIPFFFHGKDEKPPLNDLVDLNVKHYQLKADHNHCLHYIGLPTPIFPGIDPKDPDKPRYLGPERIVYISDPQAKPFYLELEGKGVDKIESELKKIEEDMAFLGASMLVADTNIDETATKAEIRYTTETSHLVDIADDISKSISKMLEFYFLWAENKQISVIYELNKDYNPLRLTAQELTALIQGQISGQYSKRTLFDVLHKGEIIPEDRTFEEEQEFISIGE